jgi:hypothetical protein
MSGLLRGNTGKYRRHKEIAGDFAGKEMPPVFEFHTSKLLRERRNQAMRRISIPECGAAQP